MVLEQHKYKDELLIYLSNLSTPTFTESSPVTKTSSGSSDNTENPWGEVFNKLKETSAFVYLDSPIVIGNGLCDSVYNIFDNFWKNGEIVMLVC